MESVLRAILNASNNNRFSVQIVNLIRNQINDKKNPFGGPSNFSLEIKSDNNNHQPAMMIPLSYVRFLSQNKC